MNNTVTIHYSIGDMIPLESITLLSNLYSLVGKDRFRDIIWNDIYPEFAMAYIHPCDDMRSTPMFDGIQDAFINAYT